MSDLRTNLAAVSREDMIDVICDQVDLIKQLTRAVERGNRDLERMTVTLARSADLTNRALALNQELFARLECALRR